MKSQIIKELGQADILLPSLIADGLAANDRVKVRLSALQAAAQHAHAPEPRPTDLSAECRAANIAPAELASLIGGAHATTSGRFAAPGLARLVQDIESDTRAMIRAVKAGRSTEGNAAERRLDTMQRAGLLTASDDIAFERVAWLTAAQDESDSLHRLVMDLHKALNRIAADCAEEIIDGAHVYGVAAEDRSAIVAFMRGLNATRALKFDHPGLDTMATRSGDRLLIQNDIGTTDAHVMVIAVDGRSVTVTYTDVHQARAKFFIRLFDAFAASWSGLDRRTGAGLADENAFVLVTGQFHGADLQARDEFLAALGAALVFLIDWNKARKLLRTWVSKDDALKILDWAARNRIGHRAFLELGGSELLGGAVRNAAPNRIGFGERLDRALGRTTAIEFLKAALRDATEGLLAGRSVRVVRDQIEADLVRHLDRADGALLGIVLRQLGLAHDIAAALSRDLGAFQSGLTGGRELLAARAARIEQKADRIAIEARQEIARLNAEPLIAQLVDRVEETVDELEQAAFIASLAPAAMPADLLAALADLCNVAIGAIEAAASGLAAAADVPEGRRVDSDDALAAVLRLMDAEHAADAQERRITTLVFTGTFDVATSLAALELARAVERATDRMASFGHLLRQYILIDLAG
ncbi:MULTISPECIES: hypothetical protein [Bradyrhizobium]|jgi:uncharacterized protein Yka (UPF0111/DUF47 family)|uniref:Phosphate transport regulator n=2 Tax=Bradyrhizobium TaxID=374 RepID=A0ABS5GAA4_9BRAD|nr:MULTISPECIES: hypothetical protein [Bradyrhizobium]RTL97032.1 MAG: hypothetical protein EKK32_21665 [Bradyrhizobiaceae bacterium]MBR1137964.1 hypothetical protein [Bradyrhizobium denitrificans]MDU1493484.1 hypothetical protein [Bradyrhizobium sp.]MDU1543779.1 hypothetical protein [Bradyrhizobium sp.]MDU1690501.1 hypothetical protein [Bradyrhizobium sp.]